MLKDVKNVNALLMGNHMESCKEDVLRMTNLLNKFNVNIEKKFDCYPKKEILKFIKNKKFQKTDLLYIQYSGHGEIVGRKINGKIEMVSCWVNPDGSKCSGDEIDFILSTLNCKIILVSDSCHSGNFGNFYKGNNPYLFIGSSSIINKSGEYLIGPSKVGILVSFFEYIFSQIQTINDINFVFIEENIKKFFIKNKIKIKPVIKKYNE